MRTPYVFLALGVGVGVFLSIIWTPTVVFLLSLLHVSQQPSESLLLASKLFLLAFTDVSAADMGYDLLISILIGINASLFVYILRRGRARQTLQGTTSGVAGGIIAILGFGCAACGGLSSVFITSVGLGGLSVLPFSSNVLLRGTGLILLLFSMYVLYKKTHIEQICAS